MKPFSVTDNKKPQCTNLNPYQGDIELIAVRWLSPNPGYAFRHEDFALDVLAFRVGTGAIIIKDALKMWGRKEAVPHILQDLRKFKYQEFQQKKNERVEILNLSAFNAELEEQTVGLPLCPEYFQNRDHIPYVTAYPILSEDNEQGKTLERPACLEGVLVFPADEFRSVCPKQSKLVRQVAYYCDSDPENLESALFRMLIRNINADDSAPYRVFSPGKKTNSSHSLPENLRNEADRQDLVRILKDVGAVLIDQKGPPMPAKSFSIIKKRYKDFQKLPKKECLGPILKQWYTDTGNRVTTNACRGPQIAILLDNEIYRIGWSADSKNNERLWLMKGTTEEAKNNHCNRYFYKE